eukprot:1156954-Pelagomonas_calceolata.AAC.3
MRSRVGLLAFKGYKAYKGEKASVKTKGASCPCSMYAQACRAWDVKLTLTAFLLLELSGRLKILEYRCGKASLGANSPISTTKYSAGQHSSHQQLALDLDKDSDQDVNSSYCRSAWLWFRAACLRLVTSPNFEFSTAIIIILNAIVLGLNWQGRMASFWCMLGSGSGCSKASGDFNVFNHHRHVLLGRLGGGKCMTPTRLKLSVTEPKRPCLFRRPLSCAKRLALTSRQHFSHYHAVEWPLISGLQLIPLICCKAAIDLKLRH